MSSFWIDEEGVGRQARLMDDVSGDVNRAKAYSSANLRLELGGPELLVRMINGVDTSREAVLSALNTVQTYLHGSAVGLDNAVVMYHATDRDRAAHLDQAYPEGAARPAWPAGQVPQDTRPGPANAGDAESWETYVKEHGIDTGPTDIPVMGPANPAPPPPTPTPTATPTSAPPAPSSPAPSPPTPAPSPGPSPTPTTPGGR